MHQVEAAVAEGGANPGGVFPFALGEPVGQGGRGPGREQIAGDARAVAGGDGGEMAAGVQFALKRPQHLLGASGALLGHGQQRVGDVKDLHAARARCSSKRRKASATSSPDIGHCQTS